MAHSTETANSRKSKTTPKKPTRPDGFPLFAHATGRWAKKVRGRLHYFGPWAEPQAALDRWLDEKDYLLAGRKPPRRATGGSLSIQNACDHYLDHIEEKVEKGKRSTHWYQDVRGTCAIIKATLGGSWAIDGLSPDDFKQLADRFEKTRSGSKASPVTTRGHIHRTRGLFNWLIKAGHIKSVPQFGVEFDAPDQNEVDNHRDDKGAKLLSRRQVRALLKATLGNNHRSIRMHAAILLAINTGCQNVDIADLKFKHIDLKNRWYVQPRTKKAKQRRAKLWNRTVKAINRMVGDRERNAEGLVFVSDRGNVWHGRNCLAKEFPTYRDSAGIETVGVGFQWLRHTYITEASQGGDLPAVQLTCGHAPRSITANYIHRVDDSRLVRISKHVEQWLVNPRKPR